MTAEDPLERLLLPPIPMAGKTVLGLLISGALALVLLISGTRSPDAAPERAPGKSLSAARFFMLLPEGRVEMTDAWVRRVYRWDGRRWIEEQAARTPSAEPATP